MIYTHDITNIYKELEQLSLSESDWDWMRDEYRNYMLTPRSEYLKTLEGFPPSHKKMADVLIPVIEGYAGAKKLFLTAMYHISK